MDHIGKLQQERQQMQEEVKRLREEIEELNASIKYFKSFYMLHLSSDIQKLNRYLTDYHSNVSAQPQLVSGAAACDRGARQEEPL